MKENEQKQAEADRKAAKKQAKADRKAAKKQAKIEEQKRQEQAQADSAKKQRKQAKKEEYNKIVQTLLANQDELRANNEATVTYLAKLDKSAELNMPLANVSVQARLQKTLKEGLESGKQKSTDAEDKVLEKFFKFAEILNGKNK